MTSTKHWHMQSVTGGSDKVTKLIFTQPDAVAEAVLYLYEDRIVVCCSVQSGCPVGCKFCGTGKHFVRNLTAEEIVEQVALALDVAKVRPEGKRFQIMTMSMGEPFLNFKELMRALLHLNNVYPSAELLVSTVGPAKAVDRGQYDTFCLAGMINSRLGLQFSLHESTDERRAILIPYPCINIAGIARIGSKWHQRTGRQCYLNYCCHPDNVSDDDVQRISEAFDPDAFAMTCSTVSKSTEGAAVDPDSLCEAQRMHAKLKSAGYNVRTFDPEGQDDIGGGCGQLWFVQRWLREHARKNKEE